MKKTISILLASVLIITAFAGCKKNTDSNSGLVATVTLPKENKETQCVNAIANLAIQAQLRAMLKEAKFYRLCEDKASAKEIKTAAEEWADANKDADVLCSASYLTAKRLAHIERTTDYKNTKAMLGLNNPFLMTANAQTTYRMEKFEDAKEWAEYINRIYEHAKVGQKNAYLAKILKTDVNRAHKAIEMANEILKGKADLDAGYDDATYKLLMKTKAAGKVAGFTAATIASAGGTMGVLGAAGYVASGIDTAIEVTDTTLTMTLGEDHQVTKSFQDTAAKAAPVISVVSFINVFNPEAWSNGNIDAVGQLRYVVDSGMDLTSFKVFGVEVPQLKELNDKLTLIALADDNEPTEKDKEELKETLLDMGFGEKAIEKIINSAKFEPEETKEAQEINKPFEELTVEEIDEKEEDISLSDEEWEDLFNEIYNDYLEEMHDKGFIDDDDGIWDYDPFMPFEDFPQDGDEIGFDDLSMWAKPMTPFEDDETTTEEATTEETEEEEEEEETTEATTETTTQGADQYIEDFMGDWYYTETVEGYTFTSHLSMELSGKKVIVSITVDEDDTDSAKCDYKFDGTTLTLTYGGSAVSYTLKGKNLVSSSGGENTVWHR